MVTTTWSDPIDIDPMTQNIQTHIVSGYPMFLMMIEATIRYVVPRILTSYGFCIWSYSSVLESMIVWASYHPQSLILFNILHQKMHGNMFKDQKQGIFHFLKILLSKNVYKFFLLWHLCGTRFNENCVTNPWISRFYLNKRLPDLALIPWFL